MQFKRDNLWLWQSGIWFVGLEWTCAGTNHSIFYAIQASGRGCLFQSEDCQNPQLQACSWHGLPGSWELLGSLDLRDINPKVSLSDVYCCAWYFLTVATKVLLLEFEVCLSLMSLPETICSGISSGNCCFPVQLKVFQDISSCFQSALSIQISVFEVLGQRSPRPLSAPQVSKRTHKTQKSICVHIYSLIQQMGTK